MRLIDLPTELLLQILSHVEDEGLLQNLALYSEKLHDVFAFEGMYKHINLYNYSSDEKGRLETPPNHDPEDEESHTEKHRRHPVIRDPRVLSVLLHRKPEYARLIQHLTCGNILLEGQRTGYRTTKGPAWLTRDLNEHAGKYSIPTEYCWFRWEAEYEADDDDLLLAMLLPRLVNLESLELLFPTEETTVTEDVLLRALNDHNTVPDSPENSPLFPRLTDVKLGQSSSAEDRDWDEEFWIGSLGLPNIHSLYVYDHRLDDGGNSCRKIPPRSSRVKHIEARASRIGPGAIEALLETPKALHTFIYEWSKFESGSWEYQYSTLHLHKGLQHQADSLQNLCLDYHESDVYANGRVMIQPMPSLKAFSRLKRLTIAAGFVRGIDVDPVSHTGATEPGFLNLLPPHLQELRITHAEEYLEWVTKQLRSLITAKKTSVPSLKNIIVEAPYSGRFEGRMMARFQLLITLAQKEALYIITMDNINCNNSKDDEDAVERGWGMDEDVYWCPCPDGRNKRLPPQMCDIFEYDVSAFDVAFPSVYTVT